MSLCVILASRFDSSVATLCFRFEEAGYRVVLLLAHDARLKRSQEQSARLGLATEIEACEEGDAAARQGTMAGIRARYGVPDVVIVHQPREAAWLADAQMADSTRLIHVAEALAMTPDTETLLQDGLPAGFNIIVAAHVGSSALSAVTEDERMASIRQRGGRAYEVAMLALYLASAEAGHISGATMTVHSGRYLS